MTSSIRSTRAALLSTLALLLAVSAHARDVVLHLPIADALADPAVQRIVGGLPVRFGANSATNGEVVARDLQIDGGADPVRENASQRDSTRPSDESVCQGAFADAMKRLVAAARQAGAGAAVGIVWDYKGEARDDDTLYECHAGTFRSHVSLRAQLVRQLPAAGAPATARSGFAPLLDLDAVPSTAAGKDRYAHFLTLPKPRAFAFLEDGTWRFWADDPQAVAKLFEDCARQGKRCWLYAVDDDVVWNADPGRRISSLAQWRGLAAPVAPKDEHQ